MKLDPIEARFFTTMLATDREPGGCVVCGRALRVCQCTVDEMCAWLEANEKHEPDPPAAYTCSRVRRR